ncbi:conserved protein of unknown function [Magnetospirillum sp. XM-1]|uniref:heparinase II/III family protein n=1 Tax=Magnetospirillum sp. XM-1 TaxID=1663591 RepID=UPI00073DCB7E|nr:heparinase II/III family protein [Magnetospirillum sp. XM-1]CUW37954.1 conserved protein of unknown function [Magnetospirillum sp. XM-1]
MRLWRTLRHLRPAQVAHRLWYRARLAYFRTALASGRLGKETAAPVLAPPFAPGHEANGRLILTGRIRLVGLEGPADGWAAPGLPLLWRFTLHYFEWLADLRALGEEGRPPARALVAQWLARFERFDPVAWHPYPLSLRLVSWLAHAQFLCQGADTAFVEAFHRSLHRQARHLERVWERDVGGNHLIKNLKAAITAALCLPGHEGTLAGALRVLEGEIGRQILSDGCHYERSPSYHYQVLGDLEDLAALFEAPPAFLAEAIGRMRPAAAFFVMAPGMLAQFNDGTADGPADVPEGAVPAALPQAGYWRLEAGTARLMVDCGPCCPDDLPAHAHADTLSFEFFDGGHPLVVNCGTYAYQDAAWRNRFRGTAFHSTLSVDDGDSAEVYGGFRLGRRPGRFAVTCGEGRFSGEFDGWSRLGLTHRRTLALEEGRLEGTDEVFSARPGAAHTLTARFHLHPSVTARPDGDGIVASTAGGAVWRFAAPGLAVSLTESRYSPRFHEMELTRCIRVDVPLTGEKAVLAWRFYRP